MECINSKSADVFRKGSKLKKIQLVEGKQGEENKEKKCK